jgi:hypothetical protein
MRTASCLTAILCTCLVFPHVAGATSKTARSGQVSATVTYEGSSGSYSALEVKITRGGQTFDSAVAPAGCEAPYCGPGFGHEPTIRVVDVDGDGEPEVVLNLYGGGAHCCFFADILRFAGDKYTERTLNFADPGYRLLQLDGRGTPEFLSADPRFAYRFASFASSAMPVRILRFQEGRLTDVTKSFPRRVAADARVQFGYWQKWQRTRDAYEARGALAAWAADQYRLGNRRKILGQLRAAGDAGRLKGGRKWVAGLDKFLVHLGYSR